ncbi:MAG: M61 family metallopeptidase, partial [Planctomycetes bacterium]|nr:M61 family metallopeptidase [Planctomycetota bacterium]
TMKVSYTVSMRAAHARLFEVVGRFRGLDGERLTLHFPAWVPGSYKIRDFSRHVQDFEAVNEAGARLEVRKREKGVWEVALAGATGATVRYRFFANDFSVRTPVLTPQMGFFQGGNILPYVEGRLEVGAEVTVEAPRGWKVALGKHHLPRRPNSFRAENYDVLADTPVLAGPLTLGRFEAGGKPHHVAFAGRGNYSLRKLLPDLKAIVECEQRFWGDVPYDEFTFMTVVGDDSTGGLEHLFSTVLEWKRWGFHERKDYRDFLCLCAHEFFHTWNVKRLLPADFMPYDYGRETYTTLLWFAEGLTNYYDEVLVLRAGLCTPEEYFEMLAKHVLKVMDAPGRLRMSLAEASFDSWIKLYQPDEQTPNTAISYYEKGQLAGLCLDLAIRRRTDHARSLDDVMRALWREFGRHRRGYTEDDVRHALVAAGGDDMAGLMRRWVNGREELPLAEHVGLAGMRLCGDGTPYDDADPFRSHGAPRRAKASIGADLGEEGGFPLVKSAREGTPAFEAGLARGDMIVAFDNLRARADTFKNRIAERPVGRRVALAVFRGSELLRVPVRLGPRAAQEYKFVQCPDATPEQKTFYERWIGRPWEKHRGDRRRGKRAEPDETPGAPDDGPP